MKDEITIDQFIEKHKISIKSKVTGIEVKNRDGWLHDEWLIEVLVPGGPTRPRDREFFYRTGVGHRIKLEHASLPASAGLTSIAVAPRVPSWLPLKARNAPGWIVQQSKAVDPLLYILVEPKIEDVLSSLKTDVEAISYPSFEEWASDFGYDPDSRRAEDIYSACIKNYRQLVGIFGVEGVDELMRCEEE